MTILIFGKHGVGKTNLIRYILGNNIKATSSIKDYLKYESVDYLKFIE